MVKIIFSFDDKSAKKLKNKRNVLGGKGANLGEMGRLAGEVSELDNLFGGIGETIGSFISNPLTIATGLLLTFNAQQKAIADQFGAIGVTEFRQELATANKEFVRLGFSGAEAQKTISGLANDFGVAFSKADELSTTTAELARATGQSLDDSTKLVGIFTQLAGLSAESASDIIKQTQALAVANDVAPDQVLRDVANSTEVFAKFSKDGGKNILEAAVQARKLGISLDKVAKVTDSLLNFQDSLTKEIEASVILGRPLNLQRARELALVNDITGAQQEIVKALGSEEEFNRLNAFQRQALADATGLELKDIQQILGKEKERLTLSGALAKQNTDNIVSEKAITATAQLLANLQAVAIELGESLGPTVNGFIIPLAKLVGKIAEFNMLAPTFVLLLTAMAAKSVIATAMKYAQLQATMQLVAANNAQAASSAAIATAVGAETVALGANTVATGVNRGASAMATKANMAEAGSSAAAGSMQLAKMIPPPFGLILAGIALTGLIGAIIAAVASASAGAPKLAKGGGVKASPGGTNVIVGEGGEDELITPLSKIGQLVSFDTEKMERQNEEMKKEMAQLRNDMASYFGSGGSAIRGISSGFDNSIQNA